LFAVALESIALDRGLPRKVFMLFGRLRMPLERSSSHEIAERPGSGLHRIPPVRGGSPHRVASLAPVPPPLDDEYRGLDRLDREELDED